MKKYATRLNRAAFVVLKEKRVKLYKRDYQGYWEGGAKREF